MGNRGTLCQWELSYTTTIIITLSIREAIYMYTWSKFLSARWRMIATICSRDTGWGNLGSIFQYRETIGWFVGFLLLMVLHLPSCTYCQIMLAFTNGFISQIGLHRTDLSLTTLRNLSAEVTHVFYQVYCPARVQSWVWEESNTVLLLKSSNSQNISQPFSKSGNFPKITFYRIFFNKYIFLMLRIRRVKLQKLV